MTTTIRKLVGATIFVLGLLVSGYGIFLFGGSVYYGLYSQSHPEKFGYSDAAGIGFFYGLAIIAIGIIPIALANLIFAGKNSLVYRLLVGEKIK